MFPSSAGLTPVAIAPASSSLNKESDWSVVIPITRIRESERIPELAERASNMAFYRPQRHGKLVRDFLMTHSAEERQRNHTASEWRKRSEGTMHDMTTLEQIEHDIRSRIEANL